MTVTKKEISALASVKKIPGRSWMSTEQLIASCNAHDAGEPLPVFERPIKKAKAKAKAKEEEVTEAE